MNSRPTLPTEVSELAGIAATIRSNYAESDQQWLDSPFGWIRMQSSRSRGAIGERLVAGWLAAKGFNVARSPDPDADRLVESMRVEIKFSTRWKSGVYKFQQIRDQNYDVLICLGVCPFDAHCWAMAKSVVTERVATGDIPGQHTGSDASDTRWLSFPVERPPVWLADHGGSLTEGLKSVSKLTGYRP